MEPLASFDVAVVGAGIAGLAHALSAARRGERVVVIERDAEACGASVRNFGFITVNGQHPQTTRPRAWRSLEAWEVVCREAGIPILQRGALLLAQRPEAMAVLEEFAAGPMGQGCVKWSGTQARRHFPEAPTPAGALWSPHELRVEARHALPRLAAWLHEAHGVTFRWDCAVQGVETGRVVHSGGEDRASRIVVCPGGDARAFAPRSAARIGLRTCTLQMLRIAPPGRALPGVVMSDLSLLRYEGFAMQPSAPSLRERLQRECAPALAHGVHLIVAASADGSWVIGDSHAYAPAAQPFASAAVDALILDELENVLGLGRAQVVERWLGHYPVASEPVLRETLARGVELVAVTSGTGMSTAFALAEETFGPAG